MSGNEEEIDELRQKKMEELKQRQQEGGAPDGEAAEAQREQAEAQKKAMLRKALDDGARKRLNTIRMSKPEFAEKVEQQVIALHRSGRLQGRIDEEQMKELLQELKPEEQSFDIKRR
ncbi:DNA-binding protein [Haloglomus halophilum]|uniref:DNA-binding protein n=1 Tax=Haloglomus halophilum TaxID=2962672 RepID=UPI0020C97D74|nr:DNA-binding protein [Haloglomus halophilum]